jgi:uncharacterized protein YcnI
VASVTWSGGPLPDVWADEFALVLQLPDRPPGTVLYFPTTQRCENGNRSWAQIPGSDGAASPLKEPAPALTLTSP